jgi:hypothetical protein
VTISVTNVSHTITPDRDCNYVVIRENSATPTAVFSVTLAGTSTPINLPAGSSLTIVAYTKTNTAPGPFKSGVSIGTITATTAGPFSFIGIETFGSPPIIAKSGGSGGGGTPGGTSGQMQWNNAGVFAGFGNYDSGTQLLTLPGGLATTPSGGLGSIWDGFEGTCSTLSASGHDVLCSDSTAHTVKLSANGGAFGALPTLPIAHTNIANTAVTPGSYTCPSETIAADGSITAASNGSCADANSPTSVNVWEDFAMAGAGPTFATLFGDQASGNVAYSSGTFPTIGLGSVITAATANSGESWIIGSNGFSYLTFPNLQTNPGWTFQTRLDLQSITAGVDAGVISVGQFIGNAGTLSGAYFRFDTAFSDTTWKYVCGNAGTLTVTDSGITVAATTFYRLQISSAVAGIINFSIYSANGTLLAGPSAACSGTNMGSAASFLGNVEAITRTAATETVDVDFIGFRMDTTR